MQRPQLVDEALLSDNIQQDLQKLIARKQISSLITKQISFEDIRNATGLYSLLLFAGYLNPDSIAPEGDAHTKRCKLSILNQAEFTFLGQALRASSGTLKPSTKHTQLPQRDTGKHWNLSVMQLRISSVIDGQVFSKNS
ncbi:MAG: hypothetical protein AAFV97_04250 [Bacteroidota bacterium]